MSSSRKRRKGGGSREVMRELRSKPPEINPCPPGQLGGFYQPLSENDMHAIFTTALRLLSELGMGEVPDVLLGKLLAAGATQQDDRVLFPEKLVKRCIELAAKSFTFHGRDPARNIEVGDNRVHFGTGGAAVQTLDLKTGICTILHACKTP